jgi:hypothetical protein
LNLQFFLIDLDAYSFSTPAKTMRELFTACKL